jgi:sec-independent protein translocase protein TatB
MFDLFSWSHIVILLVVALVVVGPKDLPRLMNMMGRWAGKARAMASEFRRSFDEMARQAELDELRKEIDDLKKNNPISEIGQAMSDMQSDIDRSVNSGTDGQTEADSQTEDSQAGAALEEAPSQEAPVEGGSGPRAGEFDVTDSAPAGDDSAPAPVGDAPAQDARTP